MCFCILALVNYRISTNIVNHISKMKKHFTSLAIKPINEEPIVIDEKFDEIIDETIDETKYEEIRDTQQI